MKGLLYVLLGLALCRASALTPEGVAADFVIDLRSEDMEIRDLNDDEEETPDTRILCLAPPCAKIKAEAVPLRSLPVPWAMRLKPP